MDQPNQEIYEDVQVSAMDAGEKKEKKEQLRSKVQALVSYYEEEKRKNEALEMELEQLRADQQRLQAQAPMQPGAPAYAPRPSAPQPPAFAQDPFGGAPMAPPPQPGVSAPNYTLQSFGQPPQQGYPQQRPQAPQQAPWQQQQRYGQPAAAENRAQPAFGQPPRQPEYADALAATMQQVLQTIEQVRAKLHQAESIRGGGYGYPQQPAYVDYDTVNLLDKLYDQLGDLGRELAQQQQRPAAMPAPRYAPPQQQQPAYPQQQAQAYPQQAYQQQAQQQQAQAYQQQQQAQAYQQQAQQQQAQGAYPAYAPMPGAAY